MSEPRSAKSQKVVLGCVPRTEEVMALFGRVQGEFVGAELEGVLAGRGASAASSEPVQRPTKNVIWYVGFSAVLARLLFFRFPTLVNDVFALRIRAIRSTQNAVHLQDG